MQLQGCMQNEAAALVCAESRQRLSIGQCRRWESMARHLANGSDLVLVEWDSELALAVPQVPAEGEDGEGLIELREAWQLTAAKAIVGEATAWHPSNEGRIPLSVQLARAPCEVTVARASASSTLVATFRECRITCHGRHDKQTIDAKSVA